MGSVCQMGTKVFVCFVPAGLLASASSLLGVFPQAGNCGREVFRGGGDSRGRTDRRNDAYCDCLDGTGERFDAMTSGYTSNFPTSVVI